MGRASMAGLSVGLVVMWSSGFIGGRLGTDTAGTAALMAWRFLVLVPILVLVGLAVAAARRRALGPHSVRLSPKQWPRQALLGVLSQVVYLGGVVGAIEYGVASGTSALVAALQPLLAGALAGPVLGERVVARQWLGLAVGFCGVLLVVGGDVDGGGAPLWAYALPFAGMVGLVAATLIEARERHPIPLLESMTVQCATSATIFGVVAAATGDLVGPSLADGSFWAAVAWLVVFSTFGGYGFYWLTVRRVGATHASALIYLTPPTTAVWAWAMFGEAVPTVGLVGFAVCAVGVALVLTVRRPPAPVAGDESRALDAVPSRG